MGQNLGPNSTAGGILAGHLGNTVAASDFALGAGWGGSTIAVTSGSTVHRGQATITCATGGGLAQATATVTLTYPGGAFPTAPWIIPHTTNDNSVDTGRFAVTTLAAASVVLTFSVLPVNAKVYVLNWILVL